MNSSSLLLYWVRWSRRILSLRKDEEDMFMCDCCSLHDHVCMYVCRLWFSDKIKLNDWILWMGNRMWADISFCEILFLCWQLFFCWMLLPPVPANASPAFLLLDASPVCSCECIAPHLHILLRIVNSKRYQTISSYGYFISTYLSPAPGYAGGRPCVWVLLC